MGAVIKKSVIALLLLWMPSVAFAENVLMEDFKSKPDTRWQFIADTVMGGVSTGKVEFLHEDGDAYARMTGQVSTENNGGFIQFQRALPSPLSEEALGLRLVVRGNEQRYFVHLRTSGTILPWQYYQASFDVSEDWAEVLLPLKAFKASGLFLRTTPRPESLKSVGIVAFGREHEAEVDVREVSHF
jgi:hypothetical protein